jgi:DNA-binding NarL/FixJ family response regulator
MTTAVLVDDHPVFRQGLKLLFELHGDPVVVGEASNGVEARQILDGIHPDVVLLDMVLGDGAGGISVARELLEDDASRRILFLSMVKDERRVTEALNAGAFGYATKDQSAAELIEAVRMVASGSRYVASSLARPDGARSAPRGGSLSLLTDRERQVFDRTVAGLTAAAIGSELAISPRTVETHRARILSKLGARSATELVRIAARAGLL